MTSSGEKMASATDEGAKMGGGQDGENTSGRLFGIRLDGALDGVTHTR